MLLLGHLNFLVQMVQIRPLLAEEFFPTSHGQTIIFILIKAVVVAQIRGRSFPRGERIPGTFGHLEDKLMALQEI